MPGRLWDPGVGAGAAVVQECRALVGWHAGFCGGCPPAYCSASQSSALFTGAEVQSPRRVFRVAAPSWASRRFALCVALRFGSAEVKSRGAAPAAWGSPARLREAWTGLIRHSGLSHLRVREKLGCGWHFRPCCIRRRHIGTAQERWQFIFSIALGFFSRRRAIGGRCSYDTDRKSQTFSRQILATRRANRSRLSRSAVPTARASSKKQETSSK